MSRNSNKDIYFREDGSATDWQTLAAECRASMKVISFLSADDRRIALQERYDREHMDWRVEHAAMNPTRDQDEDPWNFVSIIAPSAEELFFASLEPDTSPRALALEVARTFPEDRANFVYDLFAADFMREIARKRHTTPMATTKRMQKAGKALRHLIQAAHPEVLTAEV